MQRPKRKWLVRTLVAISAMIVFLVIYFYWGWRTERRAGEERLAIVMKQLDEQIPGWLTYYEDRNRRLAPKSENSAFDLLKAWKELPGDVKKWLKTNPKGENVRSKQPANLLASKVLIDELDRVLKPHTANVEDFRKLHVTRPGSGFPITLEMAETGHFALDNQITSLLAISKLLSRDSQLQIDHNRPDMAIMNCRAILGISRIIGDEPISISILMRMAMSAMANTSVKSILGCTEPNAGLVELQQQLTAESELPYFRMMMTAELINSYNTQLKFDQSTAPDFRSREERHLRPHRPTPWQNFIWNYSRRRFPQERAILLEHYLQLIRLSQSHGKRTVDAINLAEDHFRNEVVESQSHELALQAYLSVNDRYYSNVVEFQAEVRSTIAAIACERFRIAHSRWPNDLAEIPKSILPAVPLDPYDDQPLRLKRTETGLVVYSVGPDLVDHGGKVEGKVAEGWDPGFRLYDPAERRKPAVEKLESMKDEKK